MSQNDPYGFSFSTGIGAKPAEDSAAPPAPLFAVGQLNEFPVDDQQVLVINPANGVRKVLPEELVNALTHCNTFQTLDEHVDDLLDGDPSPQRREAIREVLKSVHESGLSLDGNAILKRLSEATEPASDSSDKPVAAIITCERPDAVVRLLDSIAEHCDLDRVHELIVIDDSRSTENAQATRDATLGFAERANCRVRYFGADQSRETVEALCAALPDCETGIRFLLDRQRWKGHYSAGVSRNFSHLLSAGRRVVVFDDDVICSRIPVPDQKTGMTFSGGRKQAWFLENPESLAAEDDQDLVQHLSVCLGQSISQALLTLNVSAEGKDALSGLEPNIVDKLSQSSRILISECASVGDPGTTSYDWITTLPDESLQRLIDHPEQARIALDEGSCWLGMDQLSFTRFSNMSQVTAFDNRELLPPYLPINRGQDLLFGLMVRFVHNDAVTLGNPWGAYHFRVKGGASAPASQLSIFRTLLSQATEKPEECQATDPEQRLGFLARRIQDLSEAAGEDLLALAQREVLRKASAKNKEVTDRLTNRGDLPASLKNLFMQQANTFREKVNKNPESFGELQDEAAFWISCFSDYAAALRAWPAIRAFANESGL